MIRKLTSYDCHKLTYLKIRLGKYGLNYFLMKKFGKNRIRPASNKQKAFTNSTFLYIITIHLMQLYKFKTLSAKILYKKIPHLFFLFVQQLV